MTICELYGSDELVSPLCRDPRKGVLIVDNERLLCQLLVEALGAPSYKIYTAHSAAAALRAVTFSNPALVLLDLRLPRLNGFEVLRAIKSSRLARVPVVVLSTSDNARDVQEAYSLRANSYLVKPVDFTRLSVMLRSVRAYWLEFNRVCDELE